MDLKCSGYHGYYSSYVSRTHTYILTSCLLTYLLHGAEFIIPSKFGSSKWSISLRFPYQNPVYTSPCPIRAACPGHLILLDFITRKILGEKYSLLNYLLCSFLHSFVTLSLLGPNILLNTLFSNTLSLGSSLNVSDQVSCPYKTTGKIIVLYILICIFLDIKLEDEKFCTK